MLSCEMEIANRQLLLATAVKEFLNLEHSIEYMERVIITRT